MQSCDLVITHMALSNAYNGPPERSHCRDGFSEEGGKVEDGVGRATLGGHSDGSGAKCWVPPTIPASLLAGQCSFLEMCSPGQCSFLEMRTWGPREAESPAQRLAAKMPTQDSVLRPCEPPNLSSALYFSPYKRRGSRTPPLPCRPPDGAPGQHGVLGTEADPAEVLTSQRDSGMSQIHPRKRRDSCQISTSETR